MSGLFGGSAGELGDIYNTEEWSSERLRLD